MCSDLAFVDLLNRKAFVNPKCTELYYTLSASTMCFRIVISFLLGSSRHHIICVCILYVWTQNDRNNSRLCRNQNNKPKSNLCIFIIQYDTLYCIILMKQRIFEICHTTSNNIKKKKKNVLGIIILYIRYIRTYIFRK